MTYNNAGHGDLRMDVDYVKLAVGAGGGAQCLNEASPSCGGGGHCWSWLWWWAKLLLVALFIGILLAVFLKWIGPFVMEKEIIPLINWERKSFSTKQLGVLIFCSLAIFPSILLPSSPSMWLAGMTFGYGYGFLLVVGGVIFGVSLPYFIGSLFYYKIQVWLEQYPKRASVIRLAGEGSLFNQFRAVALIRISPFPYIIYNYCAVATDVKFGPYFFGTLVGMVPEIFLTLYTGIIIQTIADAADDRQTMSGPQILFNIAGFSITAAATVLVTLYAKRRLKELQMEEVSSPSLRNENLQLT
ncbi:transmembrane protein 64-like isoform X1 [Salvia splendens]|uniref:transmembrane protein 64-like isoform X1 n=1 Tax=Salvia splendens TaxID=180675 RepID=UPI001C27D6BA|nr:transmembrane protein 64-like isoform X1 [Salvia splendens]